MAREHSEIFIGQDFSLRKGLFMGSLSLLSWCYKMLEARRSLLLSTTLIDSSEVSIMQTLGHASLKLGFWCQFVMALFVVRCEARNSDKPGPAV